MVERLSQQGSLRQFKSHEEGKKTSKSDDLLPKPFRGLEDWPRRKTLVKKMALRGCGRRYVPGYLHHSEHEIAR